MCRRTLEGPEILTVLKKVETENIKIDEQQEKQNVKIVKIFLEELTDRMKQVDDLFALLFQNIYYTGSYYDGLRVKEATEFDINLVLKLPKLLTPSRNIKTDIHSPSFAKYHLTKSCEQLLANHSNWETAKKIAKLFDEEYYLIPDEIKKWFQSIIDKVLRNCLNTYGLSQARPCQHGPAKTIQLTTTKNEIIDLDLVPVICISEWPNEAQEKFLKLFKISDKEKFYFMVPKPLDDKRLWRMHFPDAEKKIIYDRGCVKPLIRLLKLLRDKENWKSIASYYLKTVVMWEIIENPTQEYWSNDKMGILFIKLLEKLKIFVNEKFLPYLFYPQHNLFKDMNSQEAFNIDKRLKKIISNIEKNPDYLITYFQSN